MVGRTDDFSGLWVTSKPTQNPTPRGGTLYASYDDPVNDEDGGQPGGNIRVAFIVNPKRVQFVDRPGGTSTAAVKAVRAGVLGVALSASPGRVAPADPAWDDSRKPLVGEFRFKGRTVFLIANHVVSKGGDQPLYGRYQLPNRSSEIQRTASPRCCVASSTACCGSTRRPASWRWATSTTSPSRRPWRP